MSNRQRPKIRPGGRIPSGAPQVAVGRHARRPLHPEKIAWQRVGVPGALLMVEPGTRGYRAEVDDGVLDLFVSHSESQGWHLSVGHRGPGNERIRYPSWDELADAREAFTPDEVTMAMILPPKAEYVNLTENVLHLWEIRDPRP